MCMYISSVNLCVVSWLCCSVDLYVFCLGVWMCNALLQVFEHGVCMYKHLYCSAHLSMSNMEKRYRNKIIIISSSICTIPCIMLN